MSKKEPSRRDFLRTLAVSLIAPKVVPDLLGTASASAPQSLTIAIDAAARTLDTEPANHIYDLIDMFVQDSGQLRAAKSSEYVLRLLPRNATLTVEQLSTIQFNLGVCQSTLDSQTNFILDELHNLSIHKPPIEEIRRSLIDFASDNPNISRWVQDQGGLEKASEKLFQLSNLSDEGRANFAQSVRDAYKAEFAEFKRLALNNPQVRAYIGIQNFSDMAAACKAGGYPIPANYPPDERARTRIGNHKTALGENTWIDRLSDPSKESSPKR